MILWVNGTFGSGKTTTGALLASRSANVRVFDPEWVGYLLMNNLADHEFTDFQQLPPWRALTPVVADQLARFTGQHLVAVQTVLNETYWDELESGLAALGHDVMHVVIEADESILRQRIAADTDEPQAEQWRLDHLATYAVARTWMIARADLTVNTTNLAPVEVAGQIWKVATDRMRKE